MRVFPAATLSCRPAPLISSLAATSLARVPPRLCCCITHSSPTFSAARSLAMAAVTAACTATRPLALAAAAKPQRATIG